MNTQELLDPERWAQKTFGASKLKDIRRTARAVKVARRMAENASASLPAQMQTWKETMALYRLLKEEDVTFEALMQPHWQQTREQIETRSVVLLVQDTTEVDSSHHPKTKGLGQVGNERGRGLYQQTVLAILQESGEVLGCAMQELLVRTPAPRGETRSKRRQRSQRETDVWMRLVTRLGSFPAETTVVHVGDRGAARLWHADRVAASLGETLWQRTGEGVGHPRLGRAGSRRRRAVGMDSVDLGAHDDA
jgi:hypothetical protein